MSPFFNYKCENPNCAKIVELFLQRNELDEEQLCPECCSFMRRLLSSPEFKMVGAPPRNYKPLSRNNPKSEVRNIHEIRRVKETK